MYTINNNPIDSDLLADAVLSTSLAFYFFLNENNGDIVPVLKEEYTEYIKKKDFHEIPRMTDDEKMRTIPTFLEIIFDSDDEDKKVRKQIFDLYHEQLSYREFNNRFEKLNDDWYGSWLGYVGDIAWEFAGEWLATLDAEIAQKMHDCEGCAICEVAENSDATIEDYREAFRKQEEKEDSSIN